MERASILGIDVASEKLDLCLQSETGKEFFQLPYTSEALDEFLNLHGEIDKASCTMGMESTGDYHLAAARYFLERGFAVKILNPLLTRQYTRTTIRGTKTDKTDAELICKLIAEGHGDLADLSRLLDEDKALLRVSSTLTEYAGALQKKLDSSRRKGLSDLGGLAGEFAALIEQTRNLSKALVKQATVKPSEAETYIDSIPGFATKLSAVVAHEIGDINRFDSPAGLVAYAGLDPRIKESGKHINGRGKITKRGSVYLRAALYLAANVARIYDKELNDYYEKKKSEGRHHKEILCMISRKLLYRIYAVWKGKRMYAKRS